MRDTRITIIASGVQISVLDKTGIEEVWDENSYKRLMNLVQDKSNVIFVSGDVHYAEVMKV